MKRQHRFILSSVFLFALCAPLATAPGCNPSESEPIQAPQASYSLAEQDVCANVMRVLATSVIMREKGSPKETTIPFEIESGPVPVCVSVTSIEAKPRVLASGRFALDGEVVLGPSAFNQNTVNASATRDLEAGSHTLTAQIASAPGTKVRVYVYEGSKTPPIADAPVVGSAVVVPDKETTIEVAGGTFTFPVGAVDAPVPVTIYPVEQPYGIGDRFELLPDGLQFAKPVDVKLPYDPARIPTSTTEAELVAQHALKIRHVEEWRPTEVDTTSHYMTASIEHFSYTTSDIANLTTDAIPGGTLTKIPNLHVWIASFPLGRKGYRVSVEAKLLQNNPNDGASLPDPQGKWLELKQVTEHVQGISLNKIAINATPSGPLSGAYDEYGELKGGNWEDNGANWFKTGVARFAWSVASTQNPALNHDNDTKKNDREYLLVIGHSSTDGLEAHGYFNTKFGDAKDKLNEIAAKPNGHAILLGSTIWPVGKSHKGPSDPCDATYIPDDRNTVIAFTGDPKKQDGNLLLISTIGMEKAKSDICTVLTNSGAWDAIVLDGGDSASIVRDNTLLNENTDGLRLMKPARNVANALVVAYDTPVTPPNIADHCAAVGVETNIVVATGADSDGNDVKIHCTSADSNWSDQPFKSEWVPSTGQDILMPIKWSSTGAKTLHCTTFNKFGVASSTVSKTVQVGSVYSVTPESDVKLNQESRFVISGANLCESTVAYIPDCHKISGNANGLSTTGNASIRKFSCIPEDTIGLRDGIVKPLGGLDIDPFVVTSIGANSFPVNVQP